MATEAAVDVLDNNSTIRSQVPNASQTLDLGGVPDAKPDGNSSSSTQPPPPSIDGSAPDGSSQKEGEELKGSTAVGSVAEDGDPASDTQKKMRRAERFGITVQISEKEKRNSRAERFGTASTVNGSEAVKKSEDVKRKARAERFGISSSSTTPTDEDTKKKARLARFAPVSKVDPLEEEKRKARANRFSNPPSSSPSQVNGKGYIQAKEAVTGKAGGGGEEKLPSVVV